MNYKIIFRRSYSQFITRQPAITQCALIGQIFLLTLLQKMIYQILLFAAINFFK